MLKDEEASQPAKGKGAGAKTAQKKSRGLDLSQLDDTGLPGSQKVAALNASGIENALDALELTESSNNTKIDKHPERRFKAAYAAFEARRLPEIEAEYPGLRKQQRVEICKKEFEKSDENPFNKVNVAFDASREEIAAVRDAERKKVESRLATK
jgi:Coiled-coil domain-containing protein 124 /Oxs1